MKKATRISAYQLDASLYRIHKDASIKSDFGLDNSSALFEGGFGLFSSANVKSSIDPVKTQYYRMSLLRAGRAKFDLG